MNSSEGKKKPSDENPFHVGLETGTGHRGRANIILHIPQSIDPFVVYSPECILTSSEAVVGKGLFVWLIFITYEVLGKFFFLLNINLHTFIFHQISESLLYLAHKDE